MEHSKKREKNPAWMAASSNTDFAAALQQNQKYRG